MKSKGRSTYWGVRKRGKRELMHQAPTAHTAAELADLGAWRDEWNRLAKHGLAKPVELVRVEITPI